eukprot:2755089-Rhodomonas_salina.5
MLRHARVCVQECPSQRVSATSSQQWSDTGSSRRATPKTLTAQGVFCALLCVFALRFCWFCVARLDVCSAVGGTLEEVVAGWAGGGALWSWQWGGWEGGEPGSDRVEQEGSDSGARSLRFQTCNDEREKKGWARGFPAEREWRWGRCFMLLNTDTEW